MLATKIELKDRNKVTNNLWCERNGILEEEDCTTSSYFHSYSFRFDKPYKRFIKKNEPELAITQIEFPANASTLESGLSLDRWSKKRPRLKSAKKTDKTDVEKEENENEQVCDIYKCDCDSEEVDMDEDELDIDYNVEQLILQASQYQEGALIEVKKTKLKTKRNKSKSKSDYKKRKNKTVTFSLSKPQSPVTRQVIRVEVTSSCSFEELDGSDDEDYRYRFGDVIGVRGNNGTDRKDDNNNANEEEEEEECGKVKRSDKCSDNDFTIMCQKLSLLSRD